MIAAIIILGIVLMAAGLFIFWLLWVLKNTFDISAEVLEIAQGKTPNSMRTAYDGKYYPATVVARTLFNQPEEMMITDFSLYEEQKIVGFTICTKDSMQKYYNIVSSNDEPIDDETIAELFNDSPVVIKNVIVYSPREGFWTWKSAE